MWYAEERGVPTSAEHLQEFVAEKLDGGSFLSDDLSPIGSELVE